MTNNTITIIELLKSGLTPFMEIQNFSEKPGIYAIALIGNDFPFPLKTPSLTDGDIIYIGKTNTSAKRRVLKTHFKSGRTGSSTLRRSLGAILRNELTLKPIPRSLVDGRVRDYKFIIESENKLTEWMINNLTVSFYDFEGGKRLLKELESDIISILKPILNIDGNAINQNRSLIKELRAKCRELAKLNIGSNKNCIHLDKVEA